MEIPSVTEIQSKILSDLQNELDIKIIRPNSFLYVFSFVLAGALWGIYFFAESLINNLFLDTTTKTENILRWGDFLGIPKKNGTGSKGMIIVKGRGIVPQGTILTNSLGDEYEVVSDINVEEESTGIVVSIESGKDKNISQGELIFQSTIAGIEPIAVIGEAGITGGSDEEIIEDYRQRLLRRVRTIQTGGNRQDYINWASEIEGVGKVFVFENYMGIGTVGITFITNDRENLIPNDELVKKVDEHIKNLKPFGSVVLVYPPIEKPIELKIEISPDSPEIRKNVENQLDEMFKNTAEIGGLVYASKISEAISLAKGEESHLVQGFTNIKLNKNEIATRGEIKWIGS